MIPSLQKSDVSLLPRIQLLRRMILILSVFFPISGQAQTAVDSFKLYRSSFGSCEDYLRKGKLDKAISCYEDLSKRFPTYIKSYIRLTELYYIRKDKNKIIRYANKAIDLNPNDAYSPLTYLCNKMNSNHDEDIAILIMNRLSVSEVENSKKSKVEENRLRYTVKSYIDKSPVPGVELKNLGDSINSFENECLPALTLDGKTMVFTRRAGGNEDFFISQKDSNNIWTNAKNLGYPPNTSMPEGAAMLSADGYYLFYTRCDMPSPDGIIGGGCDLVFSYREDSAWSSPQYFGFTINTTGYEGQPCISSDNKDLYFVSNREGGYGGLDIWVSRFENNYWTKPVNLGPTINTSKNETSPFIHPDNETLYFASDGHPGLGQTDLFISRKNKNGTWKKPINLGAPINTETFDGSIVVNAKGTQGFLASDRTDSKGGLDIYSFDIYPAIAPVPTLCVKGFLLDKFYKTRLYERPIYFTYTFNNTSIGEQSSNEGDASYSQALQMGKTYLISVIEDGYRPYYKTLKLNNDSLPENLYFDIKLKQPGLKDTLLKANIRTDSTGLQFDSTSAIVLDTLFSKWDHWTEDSANVIVFMKGYYYSGDTITDTLFRDRIDVCQKKLDLLTAWFNQKGISCDIIMQDMDMLIYNDDKEWFNNVELKVIEYY
jgi:hypothetical protein